MKTKTEFVCSECGQAAPKWTGKCPACGQWNGMVERTRAATRPAGGGSGSAPTVRTLGEIETGDSPRYRTGIEEFDRVLGGGLVPGSINLVAGDPGIGKSTLLLQAAAAYAGAGLRVLYVSAEESESQVSRRSRRLRGDGAAVQLLCSTRLDAVAPVVTEADIDVLIVDSVQTLHREAAGTAPGSVAQVRDNTLFFLELAKRSQVPVLLVGHVTKEGNLAGPRVVEHMVDAVLYLEGDGFHHFRLLRAAKNRFGPTHEVGVFEMRSDGLEPVGNPSRVLLAERRGDAPGSAITVVLEGSRPMLLEIQSLVSRAGYANPRRVAAGIDGRRLALLLAVLEKRGRLDLSTSDVFVSVAGGFRIEEPAAGLAVVLALASSYRDRVLPADTVFLGEIGLAGEVRRVGQLERRLAEAAKLGFGSAMIPAGEDAPAARGQTLIRVGTVREALERCFPETQRSGAEIVREATS